MAFQVGDIFNAS